MRWALLAVLVGGGVDQVVGQREQWLVKVDQVAPLDCQDTFAGFRSALNITDKTIDLSGRIKATVISHLLHKLLPWLDEDNDEEYMTTTEGADEYTAQLLGHAVWIGEHSTGALVDRSTKAPQLYEHDKLMGRQTLDRLKSAIQNYFEQTGFFSTIWHSAVADQDKDGDGDDDNTSSKRVKQYFESLYAENLLNQIISDAYIGLIPNISLTVDSATINLGEVLCKTTELSQGKIEQTLLDKFTCATHSLLEMGLTCNARDVQQPDCDIPVLEQNLLCDIPSIGVQDPFDDNFSVNLDLIEASTDNEVSLVQGNIDRWLLRAVSQVYTYSKYDVVCHKNTETTLRTLLPGWVPIADIWLDYSDIVNLNQTQTEAPFSFLLKKPDSCDFVVVNRGSVFKSDWLIDFDYELVDLIYNPADYSFQTRDNVTTTIPSPVVESLGKLSKGYERIASETAKIIFHHILKSQCENVNSIVFTGHSMGGIIGAAQALLMSSLYSQKTDFSPRLSLISFAAPSAIDETFKRLIDQRATVRGWVIELDAVTKIPCENPLPNCDQVGQNVPPQLIDRVEHHTLPRTITIDNKLVANLMPTLGEDSFGTVSYNVFTGNLNLDSITFPGTTLFAQTHTCAYTCWMNAAYCSMKSAHDVCTACIGQ